MADIVRLLVRSSAFPKEQSTANWFASVMKVHRQTRNRKGTKIVLTATAMFRDLKISSYSVTFVSNESALSFLVAAKTLNPKAS